MMVDSKQLHSPCKAHPPGVKSTLTLKSQSEFQRPQNHRQENQKRHLLHEVQEKIY